jgi:hypothetical protein
LHSGRLKTEFLSFLPLFLSLGNTRVSTQGFTLARQVFYRLCHIFSPLLSLKSEAVLGFLGVWGCSALEMLLVPLKTYYFFVCGNED